MSGTRLARHWLFSVAGAIAFALLLVACGGGDDGDNETPQAASTTVADASATPTEAAAATADANATRPSSAATNTPASEAATPTATQEPPTATTAPAAPTATSTTAAATPTPEATATEEPEEDPFEDVEMLDPELLPNFTLRMLMEAEGIPEEPAPFALEMEVQQFEIDNYHMRIVAEGETLEIWAVDDTTYLRDETGEITQFPGTDMAFFSPSMFLQTVPPLTSEMNAQRIGEETVEGRETTHYRISGDDYLRMSELFGTDGEVPDDIDGDVDVWVDNELNIMAKQESDITWTNSDGSAGRFFIDYLLSNVGSTPTITPPQ